MPLREVVDDTGCAWRVWDTYPTMVRRSNLMSGFEAGWLTFEYEGEKRRLVPIPEGWHDASDRQLLQYLDRADVVRRSSLSRGNA